MKKDIEIRYPDNSTPIVVLGIPDNYSYRDTDLINLIKEKYIAATR